MIVLLLLNHWIADFVLQSDKMALNKSSSWKWLSIHCLVYSACFIWLGWQFVLITFVCHFLTDAVTSRINAWLWKRELRHWFFVAIGFDQWLHAVQLILTLQLLR